MLPRRLFVLSLFAPLCVGGCGAVSTVRTAFEMPMAPTPSPRELARARETKAFDSLSKSVAKLNAETVRKIFGTTPGKAGSNERPRLQPSPFAAHPALSLASDLRRGADVPVSPVSVEVSLQRAGGSRNSLLPSMGANPTQSVAARRLYSPPLGAIGDGVSSSGQDFLEAWAARESLRRSDEALLGRRNLEDRIAFQSHSALPALDLSLVSPETQLELSNLRLKLIPLLQVPPAQRAKAAAEIEAIEARLNQIWEQETARQAALLRESMVEVPARLRREGESVLEAQIRQSAAQTQERLAQVRRDLSTRLRLPTVPSLNIVQNRATAPNASTIRAQVRTRLPGGPQGAPRLTTTVSGVSNEIARGGANPTSRIPETIAAKNERVWRAATN